MSKHIIKKHKSSSRRFRNKNKLLTSASNGYITFVLIGIALFAFLVATGFVNNINPTNKAKYILISPTPYGGYNSLELHTLNFISVLPTAIPTTIPPVLPAVHSCKSNPASDEAEILIGSDPPPGGNVGTGGKIRIWVGDENAPFIAPGENVDSATGAVTAGNRTSTDGRSPFAYRWEPGIYLTNLGTDPNPISTSGKNSVYKGDAENNGTPYFPTIIKGNYDNTPPGGNGNGLQGPAIDSYAGFINGPTGNVTVDHLDEYIWDINSLGLTAGSYRAEFVVHDGDDNLAIDCINITI